ISSCLYSILLRTLSVIAIVRRRACQLFVRAQRCIDSFQQRRASEGLFQKSDSGVQHVAIGDQLAGVLTGKTLKLEAKPMQKPVEGEKL
ncbi:MAG: hypothetical protein ACXVBW_14325, partial [Bdellovibrionota bacterium]